MTVKYEMSEKGKAARKKYSTSRRGKALQKLRRDAPRHVWGPKVAEQRGIEPGSLKVIANLCAECGISLGYLLKETEKMGKYSHLKLPKFLEGNEGAHREKVNQMKEDILAGPKTYSASDFALTYAKLRKQRDKILEEKSNLQVELDAYSEMIVDKFEELGITSLKLDTGASLRIDVKPFPVSKDREEFRLWCVEQGLQKEMHLHYQTMESLVCNLLITGQNVPPGLEAFMKDKIVFTKAR